MYSLVLQIIISHVRFLFTERGRLGAPISIEVEVKHELSRFLKSLLFIYLLFL